MSADRTRSAAADLELSPCNLADPRELARVHDVQRAAYAVEARLIDYAAIPPLLESMEALARAPVSAGGRETFLGAFLAADHERTRWCVGFIATEPELIDGHAGLRISRLAVDPEQFGRGIARRLIERTLATRAGRPMLVSTGAANAPARRLYESAGFTPRLERTLPDGLRTAEYSLGTGRPC